MSVRVDLEHQPLLPATESEQVSNMILSLTQVVASLQNMIGTFGTPQDTHTFRNSLHSHINRGNDLAGSITQAMKVYEHRNKQKLAIAFTRELKKLQSANKDVLTKEKRYIVKSTSGSVHDEADGLRRAIAMGDNNQHQKQHDQVAVQILDPDLILLEEREVGLRDVERDVRQLNGMMKDMAEIVESQQDQVDSLASNITSAKDNVVSGEQEVAKAAQYQKSARSWMCYLLLLLAIVLAVLVLIFFLLRH